MSEEEIELEDEALSAAAGGGLVITSGPSQLLVLITQPLSTHQLLTLILLQVFQ